MEPHDDDDDDSDDMDMLVAKWDEVCGTLPSTMSLEDRMKQLGTLLGPDGRRFLLYSWTKTHRLDDAFWDDVGTFATKHLLPSRGKRRLQGLKDDDDQPTFQSGTRPAPSLTERCEEWYRGQTGVAQGELPNHIMRLFQKDLTKLQSMDTDMMDCLFDNEEMAKAFVKFIESETTASQTTRQVPPCVMNLGPTEAAFRVDYQDDNNVVDDFIGYVDDCQKEYNKNDGIYNAPFISLCQSSGYGKTRLLQQVALKRKLLYVCVGESTKCYPPPNHKARNFLFASHSLRANLRQRHLQQQLERCVSWCLQAHDLTNMDQFGDEPATFWSEIISHKTRTHWKPGETIWVAFDEAQSLMNESDGVLSDFHILRRALRVVSQKVGRCIFAIVVDTKCIMEKYSTPKPICPSYRPQPDGGHPFHPYILLLTHDAFKNIGSASDFQDEWSFVNCGRPLWKARCPNPSFSTLDIFVHAAAKLCPFSGEKLINDELSLLAVTLCRAGLFISPQSSTAHKLTESNMATRLLCDFKQHDHFLVTYLSDPVLTMASAQLWYEDELLVKHVLPRLRQKMIHGAVLEGCKGELVAKLLLLLGMDKTSDRGYYDGKWYKLSEFLKCCFGIENYLVGADSYVGFSHFIPCSNEPATYQELSDLLYRRGAVCLNTGVPGIDLLIPFWRKSKETRPVISYMAIQISTREGPPNDRMLRFVPKPDMCFSEGGKLRRPVTDIVSITMHMGATYQNRFELKDGDPPRYNVLGVCPESYPFLQDQATLADELCRLVKGALDLDEWMACDESSNTPQSSPGVARRREHVRHIGFK